MEIIQHPFVQKYMKVYAKSQGRVNMNPHLKKKKAI